MPARKSGVNSPPIITRYIGARPTNPSSPDIFFCVVAISEEMDEEEHLAIQNFLEAVKRLKEVRGYPVGSSKRTLNGFAKRPPSWLSLLE